MNSKEDPAHHGSRCRHGAGSRHKFSHLTIFRASYPCFPADRWHDSRPIEKTLGGSLQLQRPSRDGVASKASLLQKPAGFERFGQLHSSVERGNSMIITALAVPGFATDSNSQLRVDCPVEAATMPGGHFQDIPQGGSTIGEYSPIKVCGSISAKRLHWHLSA